MVTDKPPRDTPTEGQRSELREILARIEHATREVAADAEAARERLLFDDRDAAEECLRRITEHGRQLAHLRDRLRGERP